jgi:hypothetical protein
MHVGPYDRLPDAWTEMRDMFRASGHRLRTGPSLEVYLDDPTRVGPVAAWSSGRSAANARS